MKSSKFTMEALGLSVLATVALSAPSFAQTAGAGSATTTATDAFSAYGTASPGAAGFSSASPLTGTQTNSNVSNGSVPKCPNITRCFERYYRSRKVQKLLMLWV